MEIFTDPRGYKRWYEIHDKIYESERNLVSLFQPKGCLDVGSSPGIFHEVMNNTVSLDISIFMLKELPEDEDKVQADALHLPFRENSFRCVFVSVTICFVSDVENFIKELKRVSSHRIIICYIPEDSPYGKFYEELGKKGHKYYSHAHFIKREKLYRILKNEGLKVNRVASTLFSMDEKDHEIKEGDEGSFVCLEALKQ
ncbi:MAG: class I SAM-dependent methyltransferase [Stygiolobus sp.]|nr:class I SAM-dependent methyltransferase [Stygiolobus sp.]